MKILDYVGMAPEPTAKPLRYVMYVRKSSEDAEAQAKSLPDQIAACKEYTKAKGLLVVGEPIQESKSAKKSGNRPLFLQMLKDIEKGKNDGILAWHPDRLSRNSLEAGKIVDMVDILKRPLPMGRMSTQPKRNTRWCNFRGYVRKFCKEYARIHQCENERHSSP